MVPFRILGPVELRNGETPIPVPSGRQAIILGALVLEANHIVSTEHLIDAVWGEDPPSSARSQVHICISALRRQLIDLRLAAEILSRSPGYELRLAPEDSDFHSFEQLVQDAKSLTQRNPVEAAAKLRQALTLWRGPALSGIVSRVLESKARRLDEARLAAQETCFDIELGLGRHHELIGELTDLVERSPLRERLRGQLMLALHRSGRQAEALEVYRVGREHLVAELGLEPGEELRQLETAILQGDHTLLLDSSPKGSIKLDPGQPATLLVVTPRQLPADIQDFTGQNDQVEAAEDFLRGGGGATAPIVAISGRPGSGKSCLAVHVAHRLARHFTDGQLYRDLRGSQPQNVPVAEVLGTFLRSLGIPGPTVPSGVEERAAMYRSLLADKRMLVILEDVVSETQVMPLLPAGGGCAVIVTSRTRLTGLPGALQLEVDVLDQTRSLELIGKIIGPGRMAAELHAAVALTRAVGGLPLALRIVAARLTARPHWSLASMAGRLADERHRLDELAHGEMVVRKSLSMTYDGMSQRTRWLLSLLGQADVETIPTWVAAALLDGDAHRAMDWLEELVDTRMLDVAGIDPEGDPRYKFHGLIRIFARERLDEHQDDRAKQAALERLLGCWLHLAEEAHRRLYGGDYTLLHGSAPRWELPAAQRDRLLVSPLDWLERERVNLCAAVAQAGARGMDEVCWDLAVTLVTLFESRNYFEDWQATHENALRVTRLADNKRGMAALMCSLGSMHLNQRRSALAQPLLELAREQFQQLGELRGTALTSRNLAMINYRQGAAGAAEHLYRQALTDFRQVGDLVGEAHVLAMLSQLDLDAQRYGEAEARLDQALGIARRTGSRRVQAQVMHKLGRAYLMSANFERAEQVASEVLTMVRDNGDLFGESYALQSLGIVYGRRRKHDLSEQALRRAVEIRESVMDELGASQVRLDLAPVLAAKGDVRQARELAEKARAMFLEQEAEQWARRADEIITELIARE
ncbi:AfsR/SARP family transcriptional regulator [Nonomuraea jiangxiensis]|uniref:DNA-binding transcriptional activator of the SARP family n=1 Tax=Nonomuraea jiangxiensis TaxID=633440 RepID=A0A1G9QU92_9ACTN|nr:AfsR/SARP family transcriptional regulator [Nonomuraea jiangxiensis]SDM14599.1 DNA-binding transcriptional activator of the SARP family [Nonomuraea jiangxiensis]